MDKQIHSADTNMTDIGSKSGHMNVSIVISAFHVESYLSQCLDSVLPAMSAQDELILAMDASDTLGYEIARRYSAQYANIRVIFQNKHGLANARNCALEAASGDYILFLDGDDFVHGNALADLLCQVRDGARAADVIMTDFFIFHDDTGPFRFVQQVGRRTFCGLERLPQVVRKRRSFWNVWRYVFRKSFLRQNQLSFQENTHGEDVDFLAQVFLCEPLILFSNTPFYCYRVGRAGSLMNSCSLGRVTDMERILRNTACLLRGSDRPWTAALVKCVQWEYIFNLALIEELPSKWQPEGRRVFQRYRKVLCPPESTAIKIVAFGIQIFGIQAVSKLMFFMKCLKHKAEGRKTPSGGRQK